MKKLLLALGVATALTGTAFANAHEVGSEGEVLASGSTGLAGAPKPAAQIEKGESGQITFFGVVTARTCKIEKANDVVDLGIVSAVDINNNKAPEKDVAIKLTSCGESYTDKVSILLEPGDNSDGAGSLENKEVGDSATNAVLSVKNAKSELIDLAGDDAARTLEYKVLNSDGGSYTFDLKVQYAAPESDTVRAGMFKTYLPFTVVYK